MSALDRRTAAIQTFQAHQAEAYRQAAAEKDKIAGDTHRQNAFRMDWLTKSSSLIPNTIMAVSQDFVQKGSPLLFVAIPVNVSIARRNNQSGVLVAPVPPVIFDVRQSGNLDMRARLQFQVNLITGKVGASCSIKGVALPAPVDISGLTPQWISLAAETVMVCALEGSDGRSKSLDDDDGTYVPD